mmetsp:Transcript_73123/g.152644  ORF Transcript_73123/g.152644 Transcript_73123/m.152644 type:complete len:611 (-) Transcript_73123:55-1887(-)
MGLRRWLLAAPLVLSLAHIQAQVNTIYLLAGESNVPATLYRCGFTNDTCETFIDTAILQNISADWEYFNPVHFELNTMNDGTLLGVALVNKTTRDVIYCDMDLDCSQVVTDDTEIDEPTGFLLQKQDAYGTIAGYYIFTLSEFHSCAAAGSCSSTVAKTDMYSAFMVEDAGTPVFYCTARWFNWDTYERNGYVLYCPWDTLNKDKCDVLVSHGSLSSYGLPRSIQPEYDASGSLARYVFAEEVDHPRVWSCLPYGSADPDCQVVAGSEDGSSGSGENELASITAIDVERVGLRPFGETVAYWTLDKGNNRFTRCPVDGSNCTAQTFDVDFDSVDTHDFAVACTACGGGSGGIGGAGGSTTTTTTSTSTTTSSTTSTSTTTSTTTTTGFGFGSWGTETTSTSSTATRTTSTSSTSTATITTSTASTTTTVTATVSTLTTTTTDIGSIIVEMGVVMSNGDVFEEFLNVADQSAKNWMCQALDSIANVFVSWEALAFSRSAGDDFAWTFEAVYMNLDSNFNLTSLAYNIYEEFIETVNAQVSSTSWTVTDVLYVGVEDARHDKRAYVGEVQSWSEIFTNSTMESDAAKPQTIIMGGGAAAAATASLASMLTFL